MRSQFAVPQTADGSEEIGKRSSTYICAQNIAPSERAQTRGRNVKSERGGKVRKN